MKLVASGRINSAYDDNVDVAEEGAATIGGAGSAAGWQHGVWLVPRTAPASALRALMESPCPWGELHLSVNAFVPALPREALGLCVEAVLALPRPELRVDAIGRRANAQGTRTNLVAHVALPPGLEDQRLGWGGGLRAAHFAKDEGKALEPKATLFYGTAALAEGGTEDATYYEAALAEARLLEWEYAYVARFDSKHEPAPGERKTGLPRALIVASRSRGVRRYNIGFPQADEALAQEALRTERRRAEKPLFLVSEGGRKVAKGRQRAEQQTPHEPAAIREVRNFALGLVALGAFLWSFHAYVPATYAWPIALFLMCCGCPAWAALRGVPPSLQGGGDEALQPDEENALVDEPLDDNAETQSAPRP